MIRHTESRSGRRISLCQGGADGTENDREIAYGSLITKEINALFINL